MPVSDPVCHCGVEKSRHRWEEHGFVELPEEESPPRMKRHPVIEAAKRLESWSYLPWDNAGGPLECSHGIAAGIACRSCDLDTVDLRTRYWRDGEE